MTPALSRRRFTQTLAAGSALAALDPAMVGSRLGRAARASQLPAQPLGPVPDFAFFHVSDTHLNPRPAGVAWSPQGRSVKVLEWFCDQSRLPIVQTPFGDPPHTTDANDADADTASIEADAAPDDRASRTAAFAIHTGDVFEYSVVDGCWADWQKAVADLACPVYPVPGNHDNTWALINHRLRDEHGGDSYSFNHANCHFICLNSAGSLDPLPCWDERTLRWLEADLLKVAPDTPVFLAMHHPLSGNAGYAGDYDKLRFWELIREHHVVLIMDGHWHTVHARQWQNLVRVNGGETFRKNPGYGTVTVRDGVLRYAYRYHASATDPVRPGDAHGMVALVEKPITQRAPHIRFDIDLRVDHRGRRLNVRVPIGQATGLAAGETPWEVAGGLTATARIVGVKRAKDSSNSDSDAESDVAVELTPNLDAGDGKQPEFTGELSLADLPAGWHALAVRVASRAEHQVIDGRDEPIANERARPFKLVAEASAWRVRERQQRTGIKSPLLLGKPDDTDTSSAHGGHLLYFAGTNGYAQAWHTGRNVIAVNISTGREIMHALTLTETSDGSTMLLYGTSGGPGGALGELVGRRNPTQLDGSGTAWRKRFNAPIYAPAAVRDGVAYFGDANGVVHAVRVDDGQTLWSSDVATYAFESAPVFDPAGDRLYIGAWDGYLYGVSLADGAKLWQSWGPKGQVGTKSRYYGPADCSPIVLGQGETTRVYCTDRGYVLGWYTRDGAFGGEMRGHVSGIAPTAEGDGLFARGLDNKLARLDMDGRVVWEADVPLGRSPRPPLAAGDAVGVVSDTGLFTLLDAATGATRFEYALCPGLFVLAPLAATPDGRAWFAAGMDGRLTCIERV